MDAKSELLAQRDAKTKPHVEQYAPVWLTDEKIIMEDQAVQFHIIFRHNLYGWVSRRYRYDGFNDVLYHKGQTQLNEEDALDIITGEPYVDAVVPDVPNAYGG